jgi:hypothetical protein
MFKLDRPVSQEEIDEARAMGPVERYLRTKTDEDEPR